MPSTAELTLPWFNSYTMPILAFVLFFGWKLAKRTKWESSESADVTSFVNDPEVRSPGHLSRSVQRLIQRYYTVHSSRRLQ